MVDQAGPSLFEYRPLGKRVYGYTTQNDRTVLDCFRQ